VSSSVSADGKGRKGIWRMENGKNGKIKAKGAPVLSARSGKILLNLL
jgi:hypothetical protein